SIYASHYYVAHPVLPSFPTRRSSDLFFLEESVRALVETKALVGERGAYRLARAVQTLQIPATAQAILAARIDRLSPEHKRLLQADRKSTRLNSSHQIISYAVFCLKKK